MPVPFAASSKLPWGYYSTERLQEIGEARMERVGGGKLTDGGVDLDQHIFERRPLDADRIRIGRIDAGGMRLVAPGAGDGGGEIGAQVRIRNPLLAGT